MRISKIVSGIPASQTLATATKAKALKAEGKDVINFGPGEPDFDTPEPIKQAAKDALDAGFTKYAPTPGLPELRSAIAETYREKHGLDVSPEETIVTCGAKHAVFQSFLALIEPGDEVLIPAPYWVSYPPMVRIVGGVPVIVPTDESTGFCATAASLEKHLTKKTRVLVLNSPSNPTGGTYDREELARIARLAIEKDLTVVSDEIYEHLVYDGFEFTCFGSLDPDLKERTVIINGFSKTFSMTGWRLGWAVAPKNLITAMSRLQSQSTSNACSFAQKAAVAAMDLDPAILEPMKSAFARRRELILGLIEKIPGVTCFPPQGAFYVFPNFSAHYGKRDGERVVENSFDLAGYLLEKALVAVVPGGAFGAEDNIRLSYAVSDEDIKRGVARIADALSALK